MNKYVTSSVAIVLLTFLVACSKDDNPAAAPQTPQVTISVETQNPQYGEPVVFKAEYSGPALTSPVYEWDFGDGSDTITIGIDTVTHIYSDGGDYTVELTVDDQSLQDQVIGSAVISVYDPRPIWHDWVWIATKLHIKGTYNSYAITKWPIQVVRDRTFDTTMTITWRLNTQQADPMYISDKWEGGHYFGIAQWGYAGMGAYAQHYEAAATVDSTAQSIGEFRSFHLEYDRDPGYYHNLDSMIVLCRDIPLASSLLADTIVYRKEGVELAESNLEVFYRDYAFYVDNDFRDLTHLLAVIPTDDMWIEVRFTRRK